MPIYMQANFPGSVTATDYNNWIELQSVDFGVQRPITTKPGNVTDRESSKPNINEIRVTKTLDQTTPNFFSQACGGSGQTVEIDFCNAGSSAYLKLTLSNTLISGHQVSSTNNGATIDHNEVITLNFDKIEVRYTPYDEKNNVGSPVSTGYDLSTGTKT